MSKAKPAISATKNQPVDATSVAITTPPLEIRKARFGEIFARTGNAVCYYCIRVQELVSYSPSAIATRYHRLQGPAALELAEYGSLVVFHEVYTHWGKHIAHPQMLSPDPFMPDELQACEAAAFTFDLDDMLIFERVQGEDGEFEYCGHPCGWPAEPTQGTLEEFQCQLDKALSPYIIDSGEHPLVQQLLADTRITDEEIVEIGHASME